VQPPAGRRRDAQKQGDSRAHSARPYPVTWLDPHAAPSGEGQEREHQQQLERQDGLDHGQRAVAQRRQLEAEPADHADDAEEPDRLAGQVEQQPGVESARRLHALRPLALRQRRRGRAQARRDGQQDSYLHPLPRT
jgi:hypothetical protein